jgi:hypothetical protein
MAPALENMLWQTGAGQLRELGTPCSEASRSLPPRVLSGGTFSPVVTEMDSGRSFPLDPLPPGW